MALESNLERVEMMPVIESSLTFMDGVFLVMTAGFLLMIIWGAFFD